MTHFGYFTDKRSKLAIISVTCTVAAITNHVSEGEIYQQILKL